MTPINIDDVDGLIDASRQLVYQFNYDVAETLLRRVLKKLKGARDMRHRLLQAQSAELLAMILRDQEHIFGRNGSFWYFGIAEAIFRDLNDYDGLSRCIHQEGVAYRMVGKFPQAFGKYQEALILSSRVSQPYELEGHVRRNMAMCLTLTGNVTEAEKELRKSLSLLEPSISTSTGFSATAQKLAAVRAGSGDFKEALQLMNVAEDHISEQKNALYAFTNQIVLAAICLDIGDLPQAEESIKRSANIMANLPLLPLQHKRLRSLSSITDARGKQCKADMKPAVVILGPDSSVEALERLYVIRDAVPSGIKTIILKEVPDRGIEPVINKVWWLTSQNLNTFILMECSQASGHLNEFEALKGHYPMAFFRQIGMGDTYMTAHEPLYQSMMSEYEYNDFSELRASVLKAVDWGVACLLSSQAALRMKQPWSPALSSGVTKSLLH